MSDKSTSTDQESHPIELATPPVSSSTTVRDVIVMVPSFDVHGGSAQWFAFKADSHLSKSSKFISLTMPPRPTSNNIAVKRKNVDVQLTCVICIAAIVIILLGGLAVFVLFGLNKDTGLSASYTSQKPPVYAAGDSGSNHLCRRLHNGSCLNIMTQYCIRPKKYLSTPCPGGSSYGCCV